MKIKVLSTIAIIFACAAAAAAQSVVVTGKKVTYKRPKPISEYKKTFTINYPKIKASTPTLSKAIEATISYEKVLGLKLNEEIKDTQWLEEADYTVGYNANNILSIELSMNGSAAYPDGTSKNVVVDLRTGAQVKPVDLFTNTAGLLAKVQKAHEREIAQAVLEITKAPDSKDLDVAGLFKESNDYHKVSLNEFSIDDKGVTFHHDYGFAHVVQALEPEGTYFFSWKDLKPYIKSGGLLSSWAR